MSRRIIAALVVLSLGSGKAASDPATIKDAPPFAHLLSPRIACREADPGDCVRLRPGAYLDDDSFSKIDAEMKRLQDAETRLGAENASLKKSADGWQPGWRTALGIALSGIALGWYAHSKI